MNKFCIYHGNCADGFGAALSVRIGLGKDNVDFYPGVHGKAPPDVTDREVLIVDFSYKRDVLLEMAKSAKSILILDHHVSAEKDLVDLPDNVEVIFDMNRSGAVLAWEHFNPNTTTPQLILHIQDRDLWQFKMKGTREIQAAIFSHPYDFDIWEGLLTADLEQFYNEGVALERKHFKDINEFIGVAAYRAVIDGHEVPVLNAPYFWSSDAGHIMGAGEPFAACYWDTPEGRVYSLRSEEDGLDVSEIATKFGGGGHKHAAGFKVSYSELPPQTDSIVHYKGK